MPKLPVFTFSENEIIFLKTQDFEIQMDVKAFSSKKRRVVFVLFKMKINNLWGKISRSLFWKIHHSMGKLNEPYLGHYFHEAEGEL